MKNFQMAEFSTFICFGLIVLSAACVPMTAQTLSPTPASDTNSCATIPVTTDPAVSLGPERYVSQAASGSVTFDYSNNNGRYVLGTGDMIFETAWSRGGNTSVYAYSDAPSIRSIALALDVCAISEIVDASRYDTSSRVRAPFLGEIVIWQNTAGYYLATKVERLQSRGSGDPVDEITFSYVIAPDKLATFAAPFMPTPNLDPAVPLGADPRVIFPAATAPPASSAPRIYVSPATSGSVTFDHLNNNGRYILGTGDMAFETAWARASNRDVYVLNDPPSIRSVALALDVSEISEIVDASRYDTSSRIRAPFLGEIVIWQNTAGYYLATKVERLQSRGSGDPVDEITFTYVIAPGKSATFAD